MPYLQFKGKTAVETYHHSLPHHTLELDGTLSVLPPEQSPSLDGNLIIEGDNLLALKALLPTHAGRVRCVYIDPVYNTGNEGWVYNDNLTQPQFKEWIGKVVGKDGEDLERHDKWCCMMLPRLELLKSLLCEDGVILVSIDHNAFAYLRLLMDEVFGENNFIAALAWEKGRKNDAKFFSVGHEYMFVYARSLSTLKSLKTVWREAKPGAAEIMQEYRRLRAIHGEDDARIETALREWYRSLPKNHLSRKLSRYKQVDKYGPWRDRDISWPGGDGPRYDVIHPTTKKPCKVPEAGWRFSTFEAMQRQIDLGLVVFRDDHTEPPFRKAHLAIVPDEVPDEEETAGVEEAEEDPEENDDEVGLQVMPSVLRKQSQVAVKHLRALMGGKVFNNPKDHEIIAQLLRYCTSADTEAVFLDSFAGSGTTGHAVLQLNREDGGNRRFILVQQRYEGTSDKKKDKNICQTITAERVRRVIQGKNTDPLGGSFTYARVSEKPLLGEYRDLGETLPAYEEIARYIFFTETSRQFDPAAMNTASGKIGAQGSESLYLLYTPNHDEDGALDRAFLDNIAAHDPNPRLAVYCECLRIHRNDLIEWQEETGKTVRSMRIPFHLK